MIRLQTSRKLSEVEVVHLFLFDQSFVILFKSLLIVISVKEKLI